VTPARSNSASGASTAWVARAFSRAADCERHEGGAIARASRNGQGAFERQWRHPVERFARDSMRPTEAARILTRNHFSRETRRHGTAPRSSHVSEAIVHFTHLGISTFMRGRWRTCRLRDGCRRSDECDRCGTDAVLRQIATRHHTNLLTTESVVIAAWLHLAGRREQRSRTPCVKATHGSRLRFCSLDFSIGAPNVPAAAQTSRVDEALQKSAARLSTLARVRLLRVDEPSHVFGIVFRA